MTNAFHFARTVAQAADVGKTAIECRQLTISRRCFCTTNKVVANGWAEHFFSLKSTKGRLTRLISHCLVSLHVVAPSATSCHLVVCVVQTVLPCTACGPFIFPSNRCRARTACSIRGPRAALFCCKNRWPLGPSLENLLPVIMPAALTAPFLPWP